MFNPIYFFLVLLDTLDAYFIILVWYWFGLVFIPTLHISPGAPSLCRIRPLPFLHLALGVVGYLVRMPTISAARSLPLLSI